MMTFRWSKAAMLVASLSACMMAGCSEDDPFDFGGPRSCEIADQNQWVYDLMQQAYLFADQMPELDPADYDEPHEMVRDLRVDPDRWSRVSDKARTDALFKEGMFIGLGFRTRRDAEGRVVVADINADSPAEAAGMKRGDLITTIGGFTIEQIDEDNTWSEIYGESVPGVTVDLEVDQGGRQLLEVSLTKDWIAIETVPVHAIHQVDGRPVGYLMFATFVDTARAELDEVFAEFRREGVREVVVDLRYNGGGLISVARHFMHLLVGGIAEGRTAYKIRYNEVFADENTERDLMTLDNSLPAVDHVVFITTGSSLSASELLINSISPHVRTSIVGGTTGGKPVGSKHFEFCDKVAAPITFELVNAEDFGEYYDGLTADCSVGDDLSHALGSEQEGALAVALHRVATGECMPDPTGEGATVGELGGLRTPPEPLEAGQPFELAGLH